MVGKTLQIRKCLTVEHKSEMYKIFTIEFAILLQILVQIFAENKTKEIEALENEEKKLFKQINHAIDESVTLLKKHNDSEAVVGVDYMMKLKNQLKEINSTGSKDPEAQGSVNDTRRYNKKKLKMDDVAKFLNEKKKKKKTDDMLALDNNTIIMKKKVDDWMLQKELEKQKIKEYKLLSKRVGREKCPRYIAI